METAGTYRQEESFDIKRTAGDVAAIEGLRRLLVFKPTKGSCFMAAETNTKWATV